MWAALALLACTDKPPEPTDDPEPDGIVTIGTGRDQWEPLEDGDHVVMEHGPQGGWHVTGAVKVEGLDPLVRIAFTITDLESGVAVTDYTYNVLMLTHEEGWHFYPGMIGFLTVDSLAEGELDTPPELLAGHELELSMRVTDADDAWGWDSVRVIADKDPVDE